MREGGGERGLEGETNIWAVTNILASSTQIYSSCATFCGKLDSCIGKNCQYHSCASASNKQCLSNCAQIAITKATKSLSSGT